MIYIYLILTFSLSLIAVPYHKVDQVILPQWDSEKIAYSPTQQFPQARGDKVLRIEVKWSKNETYHISGMYLENSGTEALKRRSLKIDPFGSFKGTLLANNKYFHSSVGTGKEFRQLVRILSFRFPIENLGEKINFILEAEHPQDGKLKKVLETELRLSDAKNILDQKINVFHMRNSLKKPSLQFVFYAEGFDQNGEKKFLEATQRAINIFESNLPGHEFFEFKAVFAPSNKKLGPARDLGQEVQERDSFLGLYFPYWRKFGRWYHVIYPTSETRYRNALAQIPYDYSLALVDDEEYWGVGNYKELVAIPVDSFQFSYLLLHEFGHYMGLNEEYEGGGPTELEFAPEIKEPWSQNITFNPDPNLIKWSKNLEPLISVPTSIAEYRRFGGASKNPVGAYLGGYADSVPRKKSHKPVMQCMMGSGGAFCPVCKDAMRNLIQQDLGINSLTL